MAFVTVMVLLGLLEYLYFGVAVGRSRMAHGVRAPSVAGDENFERFHRAHQNTLEQLIVYVPAMYAAGWYASPLLAVACGLVYLIGRAVYFRRYIADPERRGPGMIATMAANLILITAGLLGAVRQGLAG